jgi:hypothetical protein
MRCRECSHILWNQPAPAEGAARACSECGTAYTVASYAFTRGKVEFHCPHCDQAYYGTSSLGHLEPAEFHCAKCDAHIGMESCVLRPHGTDAGAMDDSAAMLAEPVPWTVEGPAWRRLFRTVHFGLTRADRIPAGLVRAPSATKANVYLASVTWLAMIPGLALTLLFAAVMQLWLAGGPVAVGFQGLTDAALPTIVQALLAPVFFAGTVAASAFAVRLVPATSQVPFIRAYETICYASGAYLLHAVPGCGGLIATVLVIVNASQAVSGLAPPGQRTGPGVAVVVTMLVGLIVQSCAGFGLSLLLGGF